MSGRIAPPCWLLNYECVCCGGYHSSVYPPRGHPMRRKLVVAAVVAVLLALGTSQVIAQGDLTLESLAEQLGLVSDRVSAVESRLTPNAIVTRKGNCQLALPGRLHANSLLAYLEKYTAETIPRVEIMAVYTLVEDEPVGSTAIGFEVTGDFNYPIYSRFIYEYWDGCTYLKSSEWQAVDYEGKLVKE